MPKPAFLEKANGLLCMQKKLLTSLPYNIKMKHAREKMFYYVFFYHGITILWYFLYN